jgi:D-alanyl-D-alanine carboxypeptidase
MIRIQFITALAASFALVFGLVASAADATTVSRSGGQAELQSALDRAVAMGIPGAIALVRDGKRTVHIVSGYGNVAAKAPIRASDRFRIGSLTKTFVSTVALQLVDEGKLSLDDTVEHWLPGLVPGGEKITVRELLNMRAGLYDYLNQDKTILHRLEAGDLTHRYTPKELVALATTHRPNFAPGKSWSYCNTCYVLVGLIIEKITGHAIGAELQRRILAPLRLRDTTFDTEPLIAGDHSRGYVRIGKRLTDVSVASPSAAWAAGAIVSTADDLERFFSALNQGRLLPAPLLREMTTPTPSSAGYGLGYVRIQAPCATLLGNHGNFLGYDASAWGTTDGSWQLVLFVNLDESNLTPKLTQALNQVLLTALCRQRSR